VAFDQSGPRWLGISDLIAEPEGPTFISYKVARSRLDRLRFVTQDPFATSGGAPVAHARSPLGTLPLKSPEPMLSMKNAATFKKTTGRCRLHLKNKNFHCET
jgi:hypothetical protein